MAVEDLYTSISRNSLKAVGIRHPHPVFIHMTGFRKINLKATSIVLNFFLSLGCKRPQGQRPQNSKAIAEAIFAVHTATIQYFVPFIIADFEETPHKKVAKAWGV